MEEQTKEKLANDRTIDPEGWYCSDLQTKPAPEIGTVLVTGASGYIGGRLVPELLNRGYKLRIMVRGDVSSYQRRWPGAEVVSGDALKKESLQKALSGVHTAYYLIHSLLLGPKDFESADMLAARNFREAADEQKVSRIIYLGALGDCQESKSRHLQCRMQVGFELGSGRVSLTTLRAAIIIGSGSASYEIIHWLVKNLRVLLIPHWARNRIQPVAIRDIIKYLVGMLETPETTGKTFDICGEDVLTYEKMLRTFARIINKKVLFIPFPVSSIWFYSYFASLVTPVPSAITACLMEGLKDEVVCSTNEISRYIPFPRLSFEEACLRALTREEQDRVYTRWSDSYPRAHALAIKLHELKGQPIFTASYSITSGKDTRALFGSICTIGGKNGWFNNNWMWKGRGAVDRILLGVGTARGRKSQSWLVINDVIDFWRVEDLLEGQRLLLRAEMLLPGKAWLEFKIDDEGELKRLTVSAYFQTTTRLGKIYWYSFLPFHQFIFKDLIRQIERRA